MLRNLKLGQIVVLAYEGIEEYLFDDSDLTKLLEWMSTGEDKKVDFSSFGEESKRVKEGFKKTFGKELSDGDAKKLKKLHDNKEDREFKKHYKKATGKDLTDEDKKTLVDLYSSDASLDKIRSAVKKMTGKVLSEENAGQLGKELTEKQNENKKDKSEDKEAEEELDEELEEGIDETEEKNDTTDSDSSDTEESEPEDDDDETEEEHPKGFPKTKKTKPKTEQVKTPFGTEKVKKEKVVKEKKSKTKKVKTEKKGKGKNKKKNSDDWVKNMGTDKAKDYLKTHKNIEKSLKTKIKKQARGTLSDMTLGQIITAKSLKSQINDEIHKRVDTVSNKLMTSDNPSKYLGQVSMGIYKVVKKTNPKLTLKQVKKEVETAFDMPVT